MRIISFGILLFSVCFELVSAHADQNAKTTSDVKAECPFKNIDDFLEKYSAEVSVQKKYTKFPVKQTRIEEEADVTTMLNQSKVKFPIMPNASQRKQLGLNKSTVKPIGPNKWEYKISKEDVDFQLRFIVEKGSCWQLIETYDDSL